MANYRILIPHLLRWEGGMVNDPHDRGGLTNKGVTMATWKRYCRQHMRVASADSLRNISDEDWMAIYKMYYWDRAKADCIVDQSVANMLVDWLWNSGTLAIRHVQRLVGVTADGIMGPKTLSAINAMKGETLFCLLQNDRRAFFRHRAETKASQRKFLNGWLNRVNAMIYGQPYFR